MTRTWMARLAGAAVLMSLGSIPVAQAGTKNGQLWTTKTVEVHSPYVDEKIDGDGLLCNGFVAANPRCSFIVTGAALWTGTMQGRATFELESWFDPQKEGKPARIYYEGYGLQGNHYEDVFIEGCGRGGFRMDEWDGWLDYGEYDPATDTAPGFNRWRVQPGSGTGDLVGLRGEGVNNWSYHLNPPLTGHGNVGDGLFTGTFTCRVPSRAGDR